MTPVSGGLVLVGLTLGSFAGSNADGEPRAVVLMLKTESTSGSSLALILGVVVLAVCALLDLVLCWPRVRNCCAGKVREGTDGNDRPQPGNGVSEAPPQIR